MKSQAPKARIMTAAATLLVALYVLVSLIIVIPSKAPAPFSALESSATPMFSQSWRVFAPNIMKVNANLQAQAQWRDETGEIVTSEWVDITEIEQRSVAGSISPSRVSAATWNAASNYSSRYNRLNTEQREIIRGTFVQVDKAGNYSAKSTQSLVDQLSQHGTNSGQIRNILNYDALLTEFTGTFIETYLGHNVEWVKWRIHRSKPNEFQHRFEAKQQSTPTVVEFGWRQFDHTVAPEVSKVFQDLLTRHGAI